MAPVLFRWNWWLVNRLFSGTVGQKMEEFVMSKNNSKNGFEIGKSLVCALALGSLAGHGGESVEPEPGTLTELTVQRSMDLVAYLPHGSEPLTEYTHTLEGIVRLATTSS